MPSIADNTDSRLRVERIIQINIALKNKTLNYQKKNMKNHGDKPEIAGVSIPSPINMHMPNIAMKSNILLATILLSKNLPSLLLFSVPSCKLECEILESELMRLAERNPISIFLQSKEYKANVPPTNQSVCCRCQKKYALVYLKEVHT